MLCSYHCYEQIYSKTSFLYDGEDEKKWKRGEWGCELEKRIALFLSDILIMLKVFFNLE